MKTLNDIKRAVAKVGDTVEEDCGYRDMRVFRATGRKPRCLWRRVSWWWRRITGRYHVGIETGRGQPPANRPA